MKKIFHLGVLVLLTASFVSCSKSVDKPADKSRMAKSRDLKNEVIHPNDPDMSWFCMSVLQPRPTPLGVPDTSIFNNGDDVTLYLILSDAVTDPPVATKLSLNDASTGDIIQTYSMTPWTDVSDAFLQIPDVVIGHPFMFVTVHLDDQYVNRTITLNASTCLSQDVYSYASLPNAFTVLDPAAGNFRP